MRTHGESTSAVVATLIVVPLLLVLALTLTACGGSDTSSSPSTAPSEVAASPTSTASPTPLPVIKVKRGEQPPPFAELAKMYDYMADEPLDYKDLGPANVRGITVRMVSYMSTGYPVSALLVFPEGEGPFPVVLCAAGGGAGGAGNIEQPVKALLRAGCGALSIDSPMMRPPYYADDEGNPVGYARTMMQYAVDLRRGLDLLETLPQVDAARIGCFGYSYGSAALALLAGIDDRVKAYVFAYGFDHGPEFEAGQLSVVDAARYLSHSKGASCLFLMGRDDGWSAEVVDEVLLVTPEPKRLVWFRGGHGILPEGWDLIESWLPENL